ncbi:MAG: YciI family protein [Microthrixaceae bacterium]
MRWWLATRCTASTAISVSVDGGKVTTTDGPFAETKETIGGYYIVDVPNVERAIELAAQIPDARTGKVEVRQVMELPDGM